MRAMVTDHRLRLKKTLDLPNGIIEGVAVTLTGNGEPFIISSGREHRSAKETNHGRKCREQ
jgi:hypothetical protein